jgi:AGZA family xanthine/uracil permease-like MFS transporter
MLQPFFERYFKITQHDTTVRREVIGGVTTFITMAYIIVVNPAILEAAGIPRGPSTVATILTAVFGTLAMGFYANRPIAVAPYMGENAFIAFGLATMGIGWEMRLGSVFVSGAAFLVITLLGLRAWLANAISPSMKHSFAVGIGLFLAFIGLHKTGIVVNAGIANVPVKIGNLTSMQVKLAIGGFVLMAILMCWRMRGAILAGMVATAVAGFTLASIPCPGSTCSCRSRGTTRSAGWPFTSISRGSSRPSTCRSC